MGNYIRVLTVDPATGQLNKIQSFSFITFGSNSWLPIQGTNQLLVGWRSKVGAFLSLIDFTTGNLLNQLQFDGRPTALCAINAKTVLMSSNNTLMRIDLASFTIKQSLSMKYSPLYIESLNGNTYTNDQSVEVAVSLPMATLEVYSAYGISLGRKRWYTGLHGFYESRALRAIPNTPYAISAATNNSLVIFDIVNSPSGKNTFILVGSSASLNYSIMDIDYLENTNTIYASIWGSDNFTTGVRSYALSYCQDPNCVVCSQSNQCTQCGISYVLSSPAINNACLDCSNPANLKVCPTARAFSLSRILQVNPVYSGTVTDQNGKQVNLLLTSAVVQILVNNSKAFASQFVYGSINQLTLTFSVTLGNLVKYDQYNYTFFLKGGNIYLAFNFSVDVSNQLLTVGIINPVLINGNSAASSLILLNVPQTLLMSGLKNIPPTILQPISTASKTTAIVVTSALGLGAVVFACGLCCSLGFASAFFGFFQIIQVQKFSNVDSE